MNNQTIEIISISDIKGTDKLTEVNPLITNIELNELLIDIEKNGIKEAITLCRGLIVDGRNRVNVCKILEIKEIPCIILARNTSNQKKMSYIMTKETRRHQTLSQKACRAVKIWNNQPQNLTQKEYTDNLGVSLRNFTNAQYIFKHNKDVFEALFDGFKVRISETDKYKTSDSLTAIVKFLKAQKLSLELGIDREIEAMDKKEIEAYNLFSSRIETEMNFFKLNGLSDEAIGKAVKNLYRKAIEMGYIESVIKNSKGSKST